MSVKQPIAPIHTSVQERDLTAVVGGVDGTCSLNARNQTRFLKLGEYYTVVAEQAVISQIAMANATIVNSQQNARKFVNISTWLHVRLIQTMGNISMFAVYVMEWESS